MPVTKVVVCALALAAFWWGTARVVHRLVPRASHPVARHDVRDLVGTAALAGSLTVLVLSRWWRDDEAGWSLRLLNLLYLCWICAAGIAVPVAMVRLGMMLCRRGPTESRRMRVERNIGSVMLAASVICGVAAAAQYSPGHTRADEVFVMQQVRWYDRMAELRAAAHEQGSADPALQRLIDLSIPSPAVERQVRLLFDRWDLADDPFFVLKAFVHSVDAGVAGLSPRDVDSIVAGQLADLTHWSIGHDTDVSPANRDLVFDVSSDNSRVWSELHSLRTDDLDACLADRARVCRSANVDLGLVVGTVD